MRAFITGATGFVGSHLAQHLLACGDEVCGISRTGVWPSDTPDLLHSRVPICTGDLSCPLSSDVRNQLAEFRPDIVYHLAAISVPADCGTDEPTPSAMAANVLGTHSVVDLVMSLKRPPRIVFSSSCYVYTTVSHDQPLVSEDSPCEPSSGYGVTKRAAEQALLAAARSQSLDVVIARSFQHTGPRQSPRMIVPDWAQQLAMPTNEPIQAICLDTFLDLSDVRDIVQAYRILAQAGRSGVTYNVGSAIQYRSGNLLDRMLSFCDSSRRVVELAPGQRQHPIANIDQIASETGWRPSISIDQTLQDVLQYWRNKVGGHS